MTLSDEYQRMAANAICHAASMANLAWQDAINQPSVLYRPTLSVDGNQWCAVYGDFPTGVAGFGNSPGEAMLDFNKQWFKEL